MEKNIKKLVISNKLYFSCDDEVKLSQIEKALTFQVDSNAPNAAPRFIRRVGRVSRDTWWVPIGNIDYVKEVLAADEYNIIDKRSIVPASIPKPSFVLRDDQSAIYDEFTDSCIINGKPG